MHRFQPSLACVGFPRPLLPLPLRRCRFSSLDVSSCASHAPNSAPVPGSPGTFLRDSSYQPAVVEKQWYEFWQKNAYFRPESCTGKDPDTAKPFSILIPPPNVTGTLHIGHALTNTIQDVLVRWQRMKGRRVLWVPGLDHAGIATQSVVERHLANQKKSRHALGRKRFVDEVWKWKREKGSRIVNQLKRLGSSLDWSREVFTMDERRTLAVNEAFVRLYDSGLIYRHSRIVNWCCSLKTVISDIEVDRLPLEGATKLSVPGVSQPVEFGVMHEFCYRLENGGELVVSTTRPETIPGDVALAVHPDDSRYRHIHGAHVLHPLSGERLPIVLDSKLVDPEFGSGVVKVTPGHDADDFACGERHSLPTRSIFDENGVLNACAGSRFEGMGRFEAREAIVARLKELGLYRARRSHPQSLAICSRSGDVLEPMKMPQWYVKCEEMAKRSVNLVSSGHIAITPKSMEASWARWLGDSRDWCISRQLWWGHRVPAYRISLSSQQTSTSSPERWVAARSQAEAHTRAMQLYNLKEGSFQLQQDEDVLDTWFSSAIFPLSALGWPNDTADLQQFYPLSVMETGSDILFFWVARMSMLCTQLYQVAPFKQIVLHPLVRDANGKKMSKSIGNVVDPIEVMEGRTKEQLLARVASGNLPAQDISRAQRSLARDFPNGIAECGADALRFALCSYMEQERQINMDVLRVVAYRKFCNKIWQATRFVLLRVPSRHHCAVDGNGDEERASAQPLLSDTMLQRVQRHGELADRWILGRLRVAAKQVDSALDRFEFAAAASAVRRFFLDEFCQTYIECVKADVSSNSISSERSAVLLSCLESGLRLAHPIIPFLTEHLWQAVMSHAGAQRQPSASIMMARFPSLDYYCRRVNNDEQDVVDMQHMQMLIDCGHIIRSARQGSAGCSPRKIQSVRLFCSAASFTNSLQSLLPLISRRYSVSNVELVSSLAELDGLERHRLSVGSDNCTLGIVFEQPSATAVAKDRMRLHAALKKALAEEAKLRHRMDASLYKERVPHHIQDKDGKALQKVVHTIEQLELSIKTLS